jgi:Ca-activated chloride channel family protein
VAFARLTKLSLAAALALAAVPSRAQTNTPPAPARTLHVTVTDKQGKYIKGLTKEDFVVHDGKRRHAPASLAQADEPATVVLLLDFSGSARDSFAKKLGRTKAVAALRPALAHFIARSHPENQYAVVAFAREPRLIVEGASGAQEVLAALERFSVPEGEAQTAFYDALHLALERSARGRHAKRVVVAFTDGQDNSSKRSFAKVRRAARESDVLFYAVSLPSGDEGAANYVGQSILSELSVSSGGMALFPEAGHELLASADLLAVELRSQYALSFAAAPSEKRDGWHELKVRLNEVRDEKGKPVKLNVRAREGFYDAPAVRP